MGAMRKHDLEAEEKRKAKALRAAAPELYAALERLCNRAHLHMRDPLWRAANAALAKARGEEAPR